MSQFAYSIKINLQCLGIKISQYFSYLNFSDSADPLSSILNDELWFCIREVEDIQQTVLC